MTRRALTLLILAAACTGKKMPPASITQAGKPVGPASTDVAGIRAVIDTANENVTRWMTSNQADSLASIYAPDAVGMYSNEKALMGRDAIVAYWKGIAAVGKVDMVQLKTSDVAVNGNTAVERGTYAFKITPKAGRPLRDHGNYLVYWVQDSTKWKLKWDISTSDAPVK